MSEIEKVRETFVASMLAPRYRLPEPPTGDFLIDGKYLLEVGGKSKSFKQIANIPDSFVVADDEEMGFGNRIPLWLFGFLY